MGSQPLGGGRTDKECSERTEGGAGRGRPLPHPSLAPVPLRFVRMEMRTNCWMAGQERAVNNLGLLTHMCRLFCQRGTAVLGTGDQRKPLWCRVGTGVRTQGQQPPDARSLWAPAPRRGNTERGSGMAMVAGRAQRCSPLLDPQATSQTQGEAVCPLGSGQRAWETDLGPSVPGAANAEKALPAPSPKSQLLLTKPKNK